MKNGNIQIVSICGKVMDHLSVTFYFDFSAKEYLNSDKSSCFTCSQRDVPTYLSRDEGINCTILNLNKRVYGFSCVCISVCCK